MSEMKHTPGPWALTERGCVRVADVGNEHNFVRIASPWIEGAWSANDDEQTAANMRLIAAAPDLYEALDSIVDVVREGDLPEFDDLQRAFAALSRARGEP